MRNPERIDEICDALKYLWHLCPDLRFGQLISDVYGITGNGKFFYMEDEEALRRIEIWSSDK